MPDAVPDLRLALFFDGSWCTRAGRRPSNVAKLYEAARSAIAHGRGGAVPTRLFYDPGVGTSGGPLARLLGGATGQGLSENVREGYRFLSRHVVDPARTRILLVGFSRGAFTARALAGLLGAAGLLRAEACTPEHLALAWRHYRTAPKRRYPAERAVLAGLGHEARVAALGVFETVGTLGVPSMRAGHWAGALDRFHDTRLGEGIDAAYHALALDERRAAFAPTLFARPDHDRTRIVEQVWFPGEHTDVGGGLAPAPGAGVPVADLALHWMAERLRAHGLVFDLSTLGRARPTAPVGPSPSGIWWLAGPAIEREIAGYRVRGVGAGVEPGETSWREAVHVSVLERVVDTKGRYRPPGLVAAIEAIARGAVRVDGAGEGAGALIATARALLDGGAAASAIASSR